MPHIQKFIHIHIEIVYVNGNVPVFHINTDSLMRKLSKKFTIITAWPGYIENGNLCYDKFDGTEAIRISPDGFKIWNVED